MSKRKPEFARSHRTNVMEKHPKNIDTKKNEEKWNPIWCWYVTFFRMYFYEKLIWENVLSFALLLDAQFRQRLQRQQGKKKHVPHWLPSNYYLLFVWRKKDEDATHICNFGFSIRRSITKEYDTHKHIPTQYPHTHDKKKKWTKKGYEIRSQWTRCWTQTKSPLEETKKKNNNGKNFSNFEPPSNTLQKNVINDFRRFFFRIWSVFCTMSWRSWSFCWSKKWNFAGKQANWEPLTNNEAIFIDLILIDFPTL